MPVANKVKARKTASPQKLQTQKAPSDFVRVGVIGFGYWAPNLVRNFQDLERSKVLAVADLDQRLLAPLSKKYSDIRLTASYQDILRAKEIDAVIVATPVSTHYTIAKAALEAGKHVLVEKPLTDSSEKGGELIALARRKGKILMVGHTFEYNPAVLKIAELIKNRNIGELYYIDSVRVNLGRHQSDGKNVIWDLAPHDLSIILHWLGKMPKQVSAYGQAYVQAGIEDVAFIRLEFEGGVTAHIHVSWLAPAKMRRMAVIGSEKMALFDDLEITEKIKIADRSAQIDTNSAKMRIDYRMGDIVSPHVDLKEPLTKECEHFLDCILNGHPPLTDGANGNRVVRVLEAANESIKKGGAVISL